MMLHVLCCFRKPTELNESLLASILYDESPKNLFLISHESIFQRKHFSERDLLHLNHYGVLLLAELFEKHDFSSNVLCSKEILDSQ